MALVPRVCTSVLACFCLVTKRALRLFEKNYILYKNIIMLSYIHEGGLIGGSIFVVVVVVVSLDPSVTKQDLILDKYHATLNDEYHVILREMKCNDC